MRLNHHENIPSHPDPVEKLFSMKPVLGTKKVGDCCYKMFQLYLQPEPWLPPQVFGFCSVGRAR